MELTENEINAIELAIGAANRSQQDQLVDLQLAFVGGGIAELVAA